MIRVAGTVVVSEQVPPFDGPNFTLATPIDRSVAKFTVAFRPTRSVRYGIRVSCAAGGGGGVADADDGDRLPATSNAFTV